MQMYCEYENSYFLGNMDISLIISLICLEPCMFVRDMYWGKRVSKL